MPDTPEILAVALATVVRLRVGPSLCAGVTVGPDLVATAYHCVATGLPPEVGWRDGHTRVGTVIARDPTRDLALIRVAAEGRPVATVRTDAPAVGERVYGLGHPFGVATGGKLEGLLEWSASEGIVSAVGPWLLQTDAPLNPGNSGGPLVDAEGRVVGIVSRKIGGDGVAFVARADDLHAMSRSPTPGPALGGTWGLGGGVWLSEETSPELVLSLTVRERFVARAWVGVSLPDVEERVTVTGELRQRVGRGALSTTIDVGGGLSWDGAARGVLTARVGVGAFGLGARWTPSGALRLGVDLDVPGVLGVW